MCKRIFVSSTTVALLILIASSSFYAFNRALNPSKNSGQDKSPIQGGVIAGTVVNLEGKPVAKADVFAVSATRGSRGIRPHTFTDTKGNYRLAGLEPDTYFIEAQKE